VKKRIVRGREKKKEGMKTPSLTISLDIESFEKGKGKSQTSASK